MARKAAERMSIRLLEADVEIGFALVDEARAYYLSGRPEFSSRARHDAEEVVANIQRRLQRLGESQSWPFHPLVTELRNEIAALEQETS